MSVRNGFRDPLEFSGITFLCNSAIWETLECCSYCFVRNLRTEEFAKIEYLMILNLRVRLQILHLFLKPILNLFLSVKNTVLKSAKVNLTLIESVFFIFLQ